MTNKVTAQRIGEERFEGLADAIPAPLWILAPDGRVLYGNERWMKRAQATAGDEADIGEWTAAFHPDDRARAMSAFQAAVSSQQSFALELQMKAADDTYVWSACIGAPYVSVDRRLQGYVGFCCDISAKRRAEWALTEILPRLVAAQEAERSRIGRELHDDLGQQTALLAWKLKKLSRTPGLSRARMRAGLMEAEESLQDLAVAIHDLTHQLHPAKLKLLGLVHALEALCRDVSKESGVHVRFESNGIPSDVPERTALCVFRVTQEALQNAAKHSGALEIDVQLSATPSQLALRVSDTGHGFDPLASDAAGIGLLTMRERVELSEGRLLIETSPASGTTIEAVLPIAPRVPARDG